ncbi:MAG: hypothetical protein ACXV3D_05750 [Halobacteriota archaeon]
MPDNPRRWEWVAYLEDFSSYYLDAAHLFAENAKLLELENGTPDELFKVNIRATKDHFSYVTGSIFAINACLSAAIDDVFRDAVMFNKDPKAETALTQLSAQVIKDMANARNAKEIELSKYPDLDKILKNTTPRTCKKDASIECLPTYKNWFLLDRFQLALYLADVNQSGKPFDLADSVWREVEFSRSLRNYLVHYEPEWIQFTFSNGSYNAKQRTIDLMDGLQDRGFRNGLYPKDAELHEGRLDIRLGADCAAWAVRSCAKFLYAFYDGLPIDERKMWVPYVNYS